MFAIAGGILLAIIGLCLLPFVIGLGGLVIAIGVALLAVAGIAYGVRYILAFALYPVGWLWGHLPAAAQHGAGLAAGYVAIGVICVWCAALIIGPMWRIYRLFKPVSKEAL